MFNLEPAIDKMIDATNRGDTKTFLESFADDAIVSDFGRTFKGKAEIARWNDEENIGTQARIRITNVLRSGSEISVSILVSGNGYKGPGTFIFELDESAAIKRMLVTS